jgi:hypothetical protein
VNWAQLANGFLFTPLITVAWAALERRFVRHQPLTEAFWGILPWFAGGGLVSGLFWPPLEPSYAIGAGFWLLVWLWHRSRGRRKRAAAWLGSKSRALRDSLVRKAREAGQRRPVLQPQGV